MPEPTVPKCDLTLLSHENASKERYHQFQQKLDQITIDAAALNILTERIGALKDSVDIQLKLEDFLIKSREAGHAKWYAWTPLFTGIVCALTSAAISLIVALMAHK